MSALKSVDRWWSKRAPLLLGGALLVLATMTVMLYIGQLQGDNRDATQAAQINSLAKALDDQREAAAEGGAEVVAPPAEKIKEDPDIVEGVKGDKGDSGEPGEPGVTGSTGPSGAPGKDGRDGSPGPSGPPGEPGEDGTDGTNGSAGQPGSNGQDGVGQVGPSGPPGEPGAPGRDGVDGQDGKDGEDGKSVTSLTVPIGPVTYYCTPKEPGSTDFECSPQVGNGGPEASPSSLQLVRHQAPIPVHPAAVLPVLVALRKVKVA